MKPMSLLKWLQKYKGGFMPKDQFQELFIDELRDIYDGERQLVKALPDILESAMEPNLKEALNDHWEETKEQISRLDQIFQILQETPSGKTCEAMQSLIKGWKELASKYPQSAVRDAALIIIAERIEHYEMAVYGSLRTFAKQLDLDECAQLLQKSLNEEGKANKKFTDIAEGGFFTAGVNQRAAKR